MLGSQSGHLMVTYGIMPTGFKESSGGGCLVLCFERLRMMLKNSRIFMTESRHAALDDTNGQQRSSAWSKSSRKRSERLFPRPRIETYD